MTTQQGDRIEKIIFCTAVLVLGTAWWTMRKKASPPPPPPAPRQFEIPVVRAPEIKMPEVDLSGIGSRIKGFLNAIKLPDGPSPEELAARQAREQAEREAAAKKKKELAAKARKQLIRARNAQAKQMIDAYLSQGMQQAQMEEALREEEAMRQFRAIAAPPTPVIPGPLVVPRRVR